MLEASCGRARVLIVDDEPEIRELLCDLFSFDYQCASVSSAEEALELLAAAKFDLVISDITMSGMSGLEMIPHVLSISPETVVVMISGMQTIESAIETLRLGAFDYIMKPFDLRQVEAAVKRALEHHELREAKQRYENHLEELVEQRTI
ncbi:MAG: response regulator, partial [Acidobacteria bacterium]|nr:response regulator [Acidobacteriota bacterium]